MFDFGIRHDDIEQAEKPGHLAVSSKRSLTAEIQILEPRLKLLFRVSSLDS